MKKQNINKLAFKKAGIIELNDNQMYAVDGGSTPVCAAAVWSSLGCAGVASAAVGALVAYMVD
jgi:hypothetical protein